MAELKRWIKLHKLYLGLFVLLALIAIIDANQLKTFFEINTEKAWSLYNTYTLPSFIALWLIIIVTPALVYFMFTHDKSETIGIIAAGFILLFSGTEDLMYFAFSPQDMTPCMQWFNDLNAPVASWSTNILKERCVSPNALISFAGLGIIASYLIFKKLKYAKW